MRARIIAVTVAAAAAGFLGSLAIAPAVSADVGDGRLSCNRGEICFSRDLSNTNFQKHFWYAGSHANYTFTDVRNGNTGQGNLKDGADQVANRDTVCDVKVIDDRGLLPDDVHDIANNPDNLRWIDLGGSVDNENDRHERHRCG